MTSVPPIEGEMAIEANGGEEPWEEKKVFAEKEAFGYGSTKGPGKPNVGANAKAGVGYNKWKDGDSARHDLAMAGYRVNGPNFSVEDYTSEREAGAMVRAEVGSISKTTGPIKASLGLGVDTGVRFGVDESEIKVLGTGIKTGPRPSVAVLGSELECSIM